MAKELTELDILKKQYSNLIKINQRLKNISEGYYIAYDGTIYMKSIVPFIEKFIKLNDPDSISRFCGCMIMPNQLFNFSKNAKKTKLTIEVTNDKYYFGQDDNDELTLEVNIVNPNKDIDKEYLDINIKSRMYKRFFELYENSKYIFYEEEPIFTALTDIETSTIINAKPLYLDFNDTKLTLTKQLLMDIKKDDTLKLARLCYVPISDDQKRVFYMIEHFCDIYTCYTIFNTLQS